MVEAYFQSLPIPIQRLRAAIWLIVASLRPVYRATVDGTLREQQWYPASKGVGEQERTAKHWNLSRCIRAVGLYTKVFQTQLNCEQFLNLG